MKLECTVPKQLYVTAADACSSEAKLQFPLSVSRLFTIYHSRYLRVTFPREPRSFPPVPCSVRGQGEAGPYALIGYQTLPPPQQGPARNSPRQDLATAPSSAPSLVVVLLSACPPPPVHLQLVLCRVSLASVHSTSASLGLAFALNATLLGTFVGE